MCGESNPELTTNIYVRFLLASLNIEAILQESTIYRRRERLSKMTNVLRLEDVYGATIERIKAQGGDKSRLGMGALMWISYAEVPLDPDELCHALTIELDSTDFNADNIPSITTIVSCCQGLISVDKEELSVRLIHFTLKEYFSSNPDIFCRPHSVMAETCLTYLNSQQVKALSANPLFDIHNPHDHPFLEYCSSYWGDHMKKELSDHSRSLALQLLQEYDGHISAELVLKDEWSRAFSPLHTFSPFSGLHYVSFLGSVEMVVALIDMGWCDPNGEDFLGHTPLTWAARKGHEEVVKILLGREEVNPDKPGGVGGTPLSYATEHGHEEAVKILLEREQVNPDKPGGFGRTPFSYAAVRGSEEVVKVLLCQEEINPDQPDNNGRTPLSYAAWFRYEEVVKRLLEQEEVNPELPDNNGRTPLSHAAERGCEAVVKILLEREEVKPDEPDQCSQRGSPSVLSQDQDGRQFVVPSGHFLKLPDK